MKTMMAIACVHKNSDSVNSVNPVLSVAYWRNRVVTLVLANVRKKTEKMSRNLPVFVTPKRALASVGSDSVAPDLEFSETPSSKTSAAKSIDSMIMCSIRNST